MNEQTVNETLHGMSLVIAHIWHEGYVNRGNVSSDQWDAVMEAYVHIRRAITKDKNGKRFGSKAAYKAMRGEL
jgi:hypothetical protein